MPRTLLITQTQPPKSLSESVFFCFLTRSNHVGKYEYASKILDKIAKKKWGPCRDFLFQRLSSLTDARLATARFPTRNRAVTKRTPASLEPVRWFGGQWQWKAEAQPLYHRPRYQDFIYLNSYSLAALVSAPLPRSTPINPLPIGYSLQHCYCMLYSTAIRLGFSCPLHFLNHWLARATGSSRMYNILRL